MLILSTESWRDPHAGYLGVVAGSIPRKSRCLVNIPSTGEPPMAITSEQAQEIRTRHEHGDTYGELAAEFGISKLSIKKICRYRTHALPGDAERQPRYVGVVVPAELFVKLEEFAEKQQVDVSTATVRLLQFACKLHRSIGAQSEPST
jgi:hypothetical protein